jgi:hypothetical protein
MSINEGSEKPRKKIAIEYADLTGENMYDNTWLPFGDEKENDIIRLLQQNRISR